MILRQYHLKRILLLIQGIVIYTESIITDLIWIQYGYRYLPQYQYGYRFLPQYQYGYKGTFLCNGMDTKMPTTVLVWIHISTTILVWIQIPTTALVWIQIAITVLVWIQITTTVLVWIHIYNNSSMDTKVPHSVMVWIQICLPQYWYGYRYLSQYVTNLWDKDRTVKSA